MRARPTEQDRPRRRAHGRSFPQPVRDRDARRAPRAGRSCTRTRRSSARAAASTRTRCSGSRTASTGRRPCRPWDATLVRVRDRLAVAVQHPAPAWSRRPTASTSGSSTGTPTCPRSPCPRGRHRGPGRRTSWSAPGFYFLNWDDLYDNWMIKIRDLVEELETINFDAAARASRTLDASSTSGAGPRLRLADPGRLPPPARPGAEAVAVPLRVPQPRLRRLPRLLRLLQAGRCRASPTWRSRRWWPASRSTCSGRTTSSSGWPGMAVDTGIADAFDARRRRGDAAEIAAGQRRRARRGSRRSRSPRSRGSTSRPARASTTRTRSGSRTSRSRSTSSATTSASCRAATTSTARWRPSAPSATASSTSTPSCSPSDDGPRGLPGQAGPGPRRCSPTSRTTTSTSSTGATR